MATEVWLQGGVPGFEPLLMPVAHSFLQVRAELEELAKTIDDRVLWQKPPGAASIGFHIRHIGGSTDRLLTYARGESLTSDQLAVAKREASEELALNALLDDVRTALDRALEQVRTTPPSDLLKAQKVGRAGLPSTTLGLLFHAAEHATRHSGQALTTARILGASGR